MNLSKKCKICIALFCVFVLVCASICVGSFIQTASAPKNGQVIVIDCGHGGRDGGSVGSGGTIESEINLKYGLALAEKLKNSGFKVVLTRKDENGLYEADAPNKKLSDMNARMKIIKNANPALVVSIHMNSFPLKTAHGANCYFRKGDSSGESCANLIQRTLNAYCDAPNKTAKVGDYFILNCSYYTSVLVECGFISNPEEEQKLASSDYQDKVVYSIYAGIMLYLGAA